MDNWILNVVDICSYGCLPPYTGMRIHVYTCNGVFTVKIVVQSCILIRATLTVRHANTHFFSFDKSKTLQPEQD